jgi:uncharacterized Fe-S cluster-containing MiaB family protein
MESLSRTKSVPYDRDDTNIFKSGSLIDIRSKIKETRDDIKERINAIKEVTQKIKDIV